MKRGLLLLVIIASGCANLATHSIERFSDKYYVLEKKDAGILEGPYKMKQVLSPNSVLVKTKQQEVRIILRGCLATNQKDMDFKAIKTLGTMWPEDVYLRKDSIVHLDSNALVSVVYDPANQVYIGKDSDGKMQYDTLTYTMPQLLMFTHGYCVLDHSDTNYPLYQVFVEAENLAKKHRQGYWATHTEPPAQATTNAISNVTTNK